jgi:hypothetical protein
MERVRLRHQQAEELIVKAKEQAVIREQQLQRLRAKGQSLPPESSLLGCWQLIEQTIICMADPSKYADVTLGDDVIIFRALSPDKYVFGESISSGRLVVTPWQDIFVWPTTSTCEVTGRIMQAGVVKYRELPATGKSYTARGNRGQFRVWRMPSLTEAHWQGWEMEGKTAAGEGVAEFKAVRIEHQAST